MSSADDDDDDDDGDGDGDGDGTSGSSVDGEEVCMSPDPAEQLDGVGFSASGTWDSFSPWKTNPNPNVNPNVNPGTNTHAGAGVCDPHLSTEPSNLLERMLDDDLALARVMHKTSGGGEGGRGSAGGGLFGVNTMAWIGGSEQDGRCSAGSGAGAGAGGIGVNALALNETDIKRALALRQTLMKVTSSAPSSTRTTLHCPSSHFIYNLSTVFSTPTNMTPLQHALISLPYLPTLLHPYFPGSGCRALRVSIRLCANNVPE